VTMGLSGTLKKSTLGTRLFWHVGREVSNSLKPNTFASFKGLSNHPLLFTTNSMTTRRNISDERELGKNDKNDFKPVVGEKSNIAPAVPA
jgi:hypothetical protein